MYRIKYCLTLSCLMVLFAFDLAAQTDSTGVEKEIILQTKTGKIYGTLTTPKTFNKIPLVIIVAGSGPTDRNGNSTYTQNDCLKKLAYKLCDNQIASVRFDKRGIGESADSTNESDLRFETYINDVKGWIEFIKKDKRFSKIIIIGHSEGSLIGMIAAKNNNADMFISIAGAGWPADEILKQQLATQPKQVQDIADSMIDTLKAGKLVQNVPQDYYALFRPSVQPYMISWFKYDPAVELHKLLIPVLILQGTNDLQVSVEDAKNLTAANNKAQLNLIESMNHIFKIVTDKQANIASYNDPTLPISAELVKDIVDFINAHD
jgi:alpha/beta superfamily hydrolase